MGASFTFTPGTLIPDRLLVLQRPGGCALPSLDQVSSTRHEYVLTKARKLHHLLFALIFLAGAAFFLKLAIDPVGREFAVAVGIVFLTPGLVLLLQALRGRLILDGDVIEVHSAFRTRRATRDEIEGVRKVQNQYGRWTRVYLKQDQGAFNVSDCFTGSHDIKEWLKDIPDLDQRDATEIRSEIASHELATSAANLAATFARAKTWAVALNIFAGAVSIPVMWVSYMPVYRIALILLLACPPVGIVLLHRFPLLFTAYRRKPDPRADLAFLITWPGVGIMLSYQTSNDPTHLVDNFQLSYWVLLVLSAFIASLFKIAWKSPSRGAVFSGIVLLGGMYSIGLVDGINALADNSSPQIYQARIVKKYESHSSKGTRYYLGVSSWAPMIYPEDVDVPRGTYEKTRVGDPICFGLHPGFLRARWYTVLACAAGPYSATP